MGVQFNDLDTNGIFKTVLYPENAFDEGTELRERWSGVEITMRELDEQEARAVYAGGTQEFGKLLKDIIVDHNIEKKDGEKASNDQVSKLLRKSSTVYTYLLQEWQDALPLALRSSGKSDKSETAS